MGILTILTVATGALTGVLGLIPDLIAIKNALGKSGADFETEIKTLEGDTIQTTNDVDADVAAWLAAHPA